MGGDTEDIAVRCLQVIDVTLERSNSTLGLFERFTQTIYLSLHFLTDLNRTHINKFKNFAQLLFHQRKWQWKKKMPRKIRVTLKLKTHSKTIWCMGRCFGRLYISLKTAFDICR